jgi:alanine dehydrogenase
VVARTSTYAFLNAAFPYILEIANKGVDRAIAENSAIEYGIAVQRGDLKHIVRISAAN